MIKKTTPKQPLRSAYKPEDCELVIRLMSEGASKKEVCAALNCSYQTLATRQKRHSRFNSAVKYGELLAQAWWEKLGREASCGKTDQFHASAWQFNMKNRFGWRDTPPGEQDKGKEVTLNLNLTGAKVAKK